MNRIFNIKCTMCGTHGQFITSNTILPVCCPGCGFDHPQITRDLGLEKAFEGLLNKKLFA
jgi:hypothetical protein